MGGQQVARGKTKEDNMKAFRLLNASLQLCQTISTVGCENRTRKLTEGKRVELARVPQVMEDEYQGVNVMELGILHGGGGQEASPILDVPHKGRIDTKHLQQCLLPGNHHKDIEDCRGQVGLDGLSSRI